MTFIKLSQAQRLYVIIGISCSFFVAEISVGFYTFVFIDSSMLCSARDY